MLRIAPGFLFGILQLIFFAVESSSSVLKDCCRLGSPPRNSNSIEGQSLKPQNVSLQWKSDFEPELSWKPQAHLPEDCCFCVGIETTRYRDKGLYPNESRFGIVIIMNGGSLNMSVQIICNNVTSEPVIETNIYPDLVTALECHIMSSNLARCSWSPVAGAPESKFFYRFMIGDHPVSDLLACQHCHTDGKQFVCDLEMKRDPSDIEVLFNGTVRGKTVRNTFTKRLYVKPSITDWKVTKADHRFNISWVCPDISDPSKREFTVTYTECGVLKTSDIMTSFHAVINRQPRCGYCFAIRVKVNDATTETERKCFDADPDILALAAIIVPLTCACLAAIALVICKRNKESIFPTIPKPRDLLSDILVNNNKTLFGALHVPLEDEKFFKITLVTDSPIDNPES